MQERRNAERIPIQTGSDTAKFGKHSPFGLTDLETDRLIGHMKDVSSEGLQITTWKPIDIGGILTVRLRLPEEMAGSKFLIFAAECMWCRQGSEEGTLTAGFQITGITPSNRTRLEELLRTLGKAQSVSQTAAS